MYHFPGEYVTDFCIVHHEGVFHLFHIRGERWTWPFGYKEIDLGHAVSSDLRVWEPLAPVVTAGAPGAWDQSGVWAPDVFETDGTYYLYYTGSDAANNQAIGLATSQDLRTWTKHPANPVVVPGDWSDLHVGRDVAGRDAMVLHDPTGGRYLLYYTATMADGRACLAHAESTDLVAWRDLGPTYIEEDRSYNRLESAYVVEHAGQFYLFYSAKGGPKSKGFAPDAYPHFDIVYVIGDTPTGPWRKPINHALLLGTTCASEHPTFDGETYMLYIVQEELPDPRGSIWGASVLSDPKRMVWQADGTVRVVEHLPDNVQTRVLFDSARHGYGEWISRDGTWQSTPHGLVSTTPDRTSSYVDTLWGQDVVFETELVGASDGVASLLLRANPSGLAGYQVTLDFAAQTVSFAARFPERPLRILQARAIDLAPGQSHTLKVVAQGKFFDVYVDGTLQLVNNDRQYEAGCFGVHAQGDVRFVRIHAAERVAAPVELPAWSRRIRPRYLFPDQ